MNTLTLFKPDAGSSITVPSAQGVRLDLAFPLSDALLERKDDHLVFTFSDDSHIIISDFYATHTKDALPDFIVDGQVLSGEDFFAGLSEELLPEAGPGHVPAGGHFTEYSSIELLDGIDRLDGLDLDLAQAQIPEPERLPVDLSAGDSFEAAVSSLPFISPNLSISEVYEAGLPGGSLKGASTTSSFLNGLPPNWEIINQPKGSYGELVRDASGNWSYKLTTPAEHGWGNDSSSTDSVSVIVRDPLGREAKIAVTIKIVDDVPTARDDFLTVSEGTTQSGSLLTNDSSGADNWTGTGAGTSGSPALSTIVDIMPPSGWTRLAGTADTTGGDFVFTSVAGKLVVNADGSYRFTANPDSVSSDTALIFDYSVRDKDGDLSNASLTIQLSDTSLGNTGSGTGEGGTTVFEAELDNTGGAQSGWTPITLPLGSTIEPGLYAGTYGDFTVRANADGSYSYNYTLTERIEHSLPNADTAVDADSLTLAIRDANGNTGSASLTVDIVDDVPDIVTPAQSFTAVNGIGSAIISLNFGADTGRDQTLSIDGVTATRSADGTWSGAGVQAESFTITDADGISMTRVKLTFSSETNGSVTVQQGLDMHWQVKTTVAANQTEHVTISIGDRDGDISTETLSFTNTGTTDPNPAVTATDATELVVVPGGNYNISLIIDTSGSMRDRIEDMKSALKNMLEEISDHHINTGGHINLQIVTFSTLAEEKFDISNFTAANLTNALNTVDAIFARGGTNYEAGFRESTTWFNEKNAVNDYNNKVYFLTDGVPTFYIKDDGSRGGTGSVSIAEIYGFLGPLLVTTGSIRLDDMYDGATWTAGKTVDPVYFQTIERNGSLYIQGRTSENDAWKDLTNMANGGSSYSPFPQFLTPSLNGLAALNNSVQGNGEGGQIHVIGMGDDVPLSLLRLYDNAYGSAKTVTDDNLAAELFSGSSSGQTIMDTNIVALGESTMNMLFADTSYTELAAKVESMTGFTKLSSHEVFYYIRDNLEQFDTNGTVDNGTVRDDHDITLGGQGQDIVFSQGGNDLVLGDASYATLGKLAEELGMDPNAFMPDQLERLTSQQAQELISTLHGKIDNKTEEALKSFAAWSEGQEGLEATTNSDDTLFGGTGSDLLFGLGGNDVLIGGSGEDILIAGSGNDTLIGGEGEDRLIAGSGNDVLVFDNGQVVMDGGAGTDYLVGLDSALLDGIEPSGTLDAYLPDVTHIEVLVFNGTDSSPANAMQNLIDMNIANADGSLNISASTMSDWTVTGAVNFGNQEYTVMSQDSGTGEGVQIAVLKTLVESGSA